MSPGEWCVTGQQLIKDDSGGIDISGRSGELSFGHLGSEVFGCPDEPGQPGQRRTVGEPGDAKVGHSNAAVDIDQDVFGLDVTMNDADRVYSAQCRQERSNGVSGVACRCRTLLIQLLAHVRPFDKIHDNGGSASLDDQVMYTHQIGVGDAAEEGTFLKESRHQLWVGDQFRTEDLHRDLVGGTDAGTLMHLTHSATSNELVKLVTS